MHAKSVVAALLFAGAQALPQGNGAVPDPNQITIIDTAYSGSGCPQGSVSTSTSPDKTVITYGFDAFQTFIGPGTTPADRSKNCGIHLNLKYPGGFQYSVVDATYHGWARLDKGVTGTFVTTYFFSQEASKTSTTRMSVAGGGKLAEGEVYTKNDKIETTATVWSPCGTTGILNINNRLSLTSSDSKASGELSNDDATVAFTQQLHVSWRACTPTKPGAPGLGNDDIQLGKPSAEIGFGN